MNIFSNLKSIVSKNKEDPLTLMKPYKKINIDELKNEDFELKTYMKSFPVNQALVKFRLRGRVLHTIKTHFKSDKRFTSELWTWEGCSSSLDTPHHNLRQCASYEDLRQDLDLENEKDVIIFFQRVLQRRGYNDD